MFILINSIFGLIGQLSKNQNLFELYQKAYTPWDWHKIIFDHAKKKGLVSFSTPFDESEVDFLYKLNVPAYKIASFENNHFPLIKRIAKTKKPMILELKLQAILNLVLKKQ